MQSSNPLVRGYGLLGHSANNLQSITLLIFRLAFGWKMYLSGYRHLHDIPGMVHRFERWGIPLPTLNVYISGWTELVGGSLLIAGLATRVISIPLIFNFCVAIATAGKDSVRQLFQGGQILSADNYNPGHLSGLEAVIDDTAFPFLLASLLLWVFGPGKASLDYLIGRLMIGTKGPS